MTGTLDRESTALSRRSTRRTRRRRPARRFMIVTHRWLSLVLGLVLLVIATSGAVLLYRPEIERYDAAAAYDVSGQAPSISLVQARQAVLDAHPDFDANSVWAEDGVFRVTDYDTSWTVDPGTGEVLGHVGATPGWLRLLDNLHECFLSCDGEPGTVPVLVKEIPHTGWLGLEGESITWGGLVLGLFAFVLLYLALTGIWLWFPRPSAWRTSMRVRIKGGRFARDTDLHKVAGMVAIPFLLMWAATGASYELGAVEKAWYAATPGGHTTYADPHSDKPADPAHRRDISPDTAVAAAQALHPDATLVNMDMPTKGDPTSAYTMYFSDGFDPYGESQYPGDLGVYVDRHTGVAHDYYGGSDESTAQVLFDQYNYPVHSGYVVNGWWRLVWLVFGLSPLLLGVTGVSTWLVRRRTKRSRRPGRKGQLDPVAAQE
ncbi:MAG: PepSY-associated TM helix domain-containing protein [Nocardioides sp.]